MATYNVENIESIDELEVSVQNKNARLTNAEEPFIIDSETRTINVPSGFLLGVESDEKVERIYFQCPKIVGDNVDLSQLRIYVNYQNANGDKDAHWCDDLQTDGDNITFSWLLDRKVTIYRGNVSFIVCAKKSNDDGTLTNEWNTTVAIARVLEGLEATEQIVEDNQDVIEQILNKLQDIEDSGGTGDISNAKPTFTEASQRQNIESGESISTILGKIKKFFTDLKSVAFTGSYNDLSDKPNIPTNTSELTNDSGFLTEIPQEYVTETELEEKDYAVKSEIPTKLPNPNKLTFTGAVSEEYDGSAPLSIEIPQGGGGGTSNSYELIAESTLEEEAKQMAVGGNLDEYGIVYFYVKIEAVEQEYFNAISWSKTESFNWNYVSSESKTAIGYPYFYRGRYFVEKNRAYCEWGKASRYDTNARIYQGSIITEGMIPKYLCILSNTEGVSLPVGTHVELWGVKKS